MFQSPQTAENLTWHAFHRTRDGKLCHSADSPDLVDSKWPDFGQESKNLCLALSTDGVNPQTLLVNPHSTLSSTYSCWPVMSVIYNLPPWICIKRKFIRLSLLISGPIQSGNDLDVYLAPLIDDLKSLWTVGVETYDAFKKKTFNL